MHGHNGGGIIVGKHWKAVENVAQFTKPSWSGFIGPSKGESRSWKIEKAAGIEVSSLRS